LIKVLLVDDHILMRAGIKKLLEGVNGIQVVGEASNGEAGLELARELQPNIVLMDIKMPGIGGLETTRRFVHSFPTIKVIALTACTAEPFPSRMLQAGATGYVSKTRPFEDVVEAIRTVFAGQRYLSSDIAQIIAMKHLSHQEESPFDNLSTREMQVMLMIATGKKVHDISNSLCLSSKTVNTYRYRLFEKLNIKNDVALTHLAIRHGLLGNETDA
jgi:two-component system invasion response regulator UvrY